MRLCPLCGVDVETETHALINCNAFDDLRTPLFSAAENVLVDFNNLTDLDKLVFILTNDNLVKISAKTCMFLLNRRRELLYFL